MSGCGQILKSRTPPMKIKIKCREPKRPEPLDAIVIDDETHRSAFEFDIVVRGISCRCIVSEELEKIIDDVINAGHQSRFSGFEAFLSAELIKELTFLKVNVHGLKTIQQLSVLRRAPRFESASEYDIWDFHVTLWLSILFGGRIQEILGILVDAMRSNETLVDSTHFNVALNFVRLLSHVKHHVVVRRHSN